VIAVGLVFDQGAHAHDIARHRFIGDDSRSFQLRQQLLRGIRHGVEGRVRQAGQARVIAAAHDDLRQAPRIVVMRWLFHELSFVRLSRNGTLVLLS
jgi:hypothetical protein